MIATVVGHGPSPVSKGWGSVIDEHDVIRMHDISWQNERDYGKRTSFTIIPGPWAARANLPRFDSRFRRSFTDKPDKAWLCYTLNPKQIAKEHLGLPVLWFDLSRFVEMLKPEREGIHDIVPTRGSAAVLMAMELGATTVRLVGMDSVVGGAITDYAPGAGRLRRPQWKGQAFNSRHDYERERDALWIIAEEKGVTLEVMGRASLGTATPGARVASSALAAAR